MTFIEKLKKRQRAVNSMLCVGLDTDKDEDLVLAFNKAIIDATAEFVCSYKINLSFYSVSGRMQVTLKDTIDYIHGNHPGIPVILDAKEGDTANSAKKYVQGVFGRFEVDAATINPYLGQDSCQPFLDQKDKGIFILCKTSNLGSQDFQDLVVQPPARPPYRACYLWEYVAFEVVNFWNKNNNCGLVIGATYPEALKTVRQVVGDMPILVPGIGAQEGNLEDVVRYGLDSTGFGLIISVSRSVIYASSGPDFATAAAREARKLRNQINEIKAQISGAV